MISHFKKVILKQNFNRLGLYKNIKELSHFISGRVLDVGLGEIFCFVLPKNDDLYLDNIMVVVKK